MIPISMIALKNGLSNGIWSRENILVCIFSSLQNVKQWNLALMLWENEHISSIFSLCMNGIAISTTHVCKVELDSEGFNIHEGLWTPHSKGTLSTMTWVLSQHLWIECSCYFENVTLFKLSRITKKMVSSQACKKDKIFSNLYRRVNLLLYHQCKTSLLLTNS